MDPNEALKNILHLAKKVQDDDSEFDDAEKLIYMAGDLADAVVALDAWLVNGGFLPQRWERK